MGHRLLAIDHVQLAMPPGGEGEARSFYSGLLGLDEQSKPAPLAARGGCWFSNGDIAVHLGVDEDFRPARKAHPALRVQGFASLGAVLEAAGHPVRPDHAIPGVQRCYVDDPFGNRIELIEG